MYIDSISDGETAKLWYTSLLNCLPDHTHEHTKRAPQSPLNYVQILVHLGIEDMVFM